MYPRNYIRPAESHTFQVIVFFFCLLHALKSLIFFDYNMHIITFDKVRNI